MSREQVRVLELNKEIERVLSHDGSELLSSDLLHGVSQAFTKSTLKRKLEKELTLCREHIAQWRASIIETDKRRDMLSAEINEKHNQLNGRKAALQQFDRRYNIVHSMRPAVSEQPKDLKKYYFAHWRSRASDRLNMKKTLETLTRSCKRRIYAGAWLKLNLVATRRREVPNKGVDGIGGLLLDLAENTLITNLADATLLVGVVNDIKEEICVVNDVDRNQHNLNPTNALPINILSKDDDRASLMKGDFLFRAGHYASSLQVFQQLLSRMESREFFAGMSSTDAATLKSEVNGKIGNVYVKLGSFDRAIIYFGRQMSIAEEENLDTPKTCALLGLGRCYLEKYDYLYAETLLKRALDFSLSRGDDANTLVAYTIMKKCNDGLNRPEEAAAFATKIEDMDVSSWNRESGGTTVSRNEVDYALKKLDSMESRLTHTYPAQVLKLEVVSSHQVRLQKALLDKERELREALEQLAVSELQSKELQELLEQIEEEITDAKSTTKNSLVSNLLQGSKQNIKTATLLFRLEEELKIICSKQATCLAEISATNMMIHNARDDIAVLKEEIDIERGPLMNRVLEGRTYHCASFNASNVIQDDVAGETTNREWVASSEGQKVYIHSLRTGKVQHVLIDNEDGCDATVCSLFFYGDRIYTGTMNGTLFAWLLTSKMLFKAKTHEAGITSLWADESKIVTGSADKSIILRSADGVMIRRIIGHSRGVHHLLCGANSIVSASFDTVFVWDMKQTENKFQEVGNIHNTKVFRWTCIDKVRVEIYRQAIYRHFSELISKSSLFANDMQVTCRLRLVLSEGHVTSLHFGELEVITGDNLGSISVWWVDSGLELQRFKAHDGPVMSLQVDAVKAVSCGLDMAIKISDIIKGQVIHTLRGHTAPIITVAFDRRQIVSLSSEGEVHYWFWESPCCPGSKEREALEAQKEFAALVANEDVTQSQT
jgi:WD40 repeat protein